MIKRAGWVRAVFGMVGLAAPLAVAFACSAGLDGPGEPTATELAGAQSACATHADCDSGSGELCCVGRCRPRTADTKKVVRLGTDGNLEYHCYAGEPPDDGSPAPAEINVVPDFSYAGYKMGGVAIPSGSRTIGVASPTGGNDSPMIQRAIDDAVLLLGQGVAPPVAVLLKKQTYLLDQPLNIQAGVVLRGLGQESDGTVLKSRITSAHNLIRVGPADPSSTFPKESNEQLQILSMPVPVGTREITVKKPVGTPIVAGDTVAVVRTPNEDWLNDLHTGNFNAATGKPWLEDPWQAANFRVPQLRKVLVATNVTGGLKLSLDLPIVDGIVSGYGGGYVAKVLDDGGFVESAGVEDLRIDAQFNDDTPERCSDGKQCDCPDDCETNADCHGGTCVDEECVCTCNDDDVNVACSQPSDCPRGFECRSGTCRCPKASGFCTNGTLCKLDDNDWNAILFTRTRNSWVRRVTVKTYAMSAVKITGWSRFNTVEEVAHVDPKSPLHPPPPGDTGLPYSSHRYSFWVSSGSAGNLFQRCFTKSSRHSFVAGGQVTGPNVWLDSLSINVNAEEGPHLHWATGLLFDNIQTRASQLAEDSNPDLLAGGIRAQNNGDGGTGHGWTGGQVMIWNAQAPVVAYSPAGGANWVVGGIADQEPSSKNLGEELGIWQTYETVVKPRSLYLQQLKERFYKAGGNGDNAVAAVTSSQQRAGRIWNALRAWAGSGKLADFYPNPTACSSGKQNDEVCCARECIQCGGEGCGTAGNGGDADRCCVSDITENGRSCLHYPPPCLLPAPNCEGGIRNGQVCCLGFNCAHANRSCFEYPPPCIMADPNCVTGTQGGTVCCAKECTQCGGSGCSGPNPPNTSATCCSGGIPSGNLCTNRGPPCHGAAPIVFYP